MSKYLESVGQQHLFYAKDGSVVRNLEDLRDRLFAMDEAIFEHHVNAEKNDFRSWVHDVVQDKELAESLAKAKTRLDMAEVVRRRIKHLHTLHARPEVHREEPQQRPHPGFKDFLQGVALGVVIGLILARILY